MAMKLSALERIVKGEPVKRICDELSVGKSTANDQQQNRKKFKISAHKLNWTRHFQVTARSKNLTMKLLMTFLVMVYAEAQKKNSNQWFNFKRKSATFAFLD